jgi:hypothetical protein
MLSSEEEKMLRKAIKNSLIEKENTLKSLDLVEDMKVFYPTMEEFKEPIVYFEKLFKQGASKYGTVKIVPPRDFKPTLAFDCL